MCCLTMVTLLMIPTKKTLEWNDRHCSLNYISTDTLLLCSETPMVETQTDFVEKVRLSAASIHCMACQYKELRLQSSEEMGLLTHAGTLLVGTNAKMTST
ncbi:hypothetical protein ILYODFUR_031479 [Ilyodon furcidens]|uniref:Uncharacterized protein n=1 Tax=Ilyodon furcidens TaxID=33524 RepID=A0ABV0UMX3_9TELE